MAPTNVFAVLGAVASDPLLIASAGPGVATFMSVAISPILEESRQRLEPD